MYTIFNNIPIEISIIKIISTLILFSTIFFLCNCSDEPVAPVPDPNELEYVIPEDVRAVVHDVLRHRIGVTYEAEAENITSEEIINKIVNEVEVP